MGLTVVDATEEHLPAIAAIYARAAEESHATFDLEGQPVEWWAQVIAVSYTHLTLPTILLV